MSGGVSVTKSYTSWAAEPGRQSRLLSSRVAHGSAHSFSSACDGLGPNQGGTWLPLSGDQEEGKGKKGVLFGVTGMFTPMCPKTHLPVFVE